MLKGFHNRFSQVLFNRFSHIGVGYPADKIVPVSVFSLCFSHIGGGHPTDKIVSVSAFFCVSHTLAVATRQTKLFQLVLFFVSHTLAVATRQTTLYNLVMFLTTALSPKENTHRSHTAVPKVFINTRCTEQTDIMCFPRHATILAKCACPKQKNLSFFLWLHQDALAPNRKKKLSGCFFFNGLAKMCLPRTTKSIKLLALFNGLTTMCVHHMTLTKWWIHNT